MSKAMTCPKCGNMSFTGCAKCLRGDMWQCEKCGFLAHESYLMGKPLPSSGEKFKCPQCGKGIEAILPCKTCRGEEWKCQNCGYTAKLSSFKPIEEQKKKRTCCGQ